MRNWNFIAWGLLVIAGCTGGSRLEPVTGTVKLDGKPISGAVVTFQPVDGGTGGPAVGTTDSSGVYKIVDLTAPDGSGAVAGDYLVGIMWYKPSANDTSKASGDSGETQTSADDKQSRQGVDGPDSLLPVAYHNPQMSGLKASVKSGGGDFSFNLDSKFKGEAK